MRISAFTIFVISLIFTLLILGTSRHRAEAFNASNNESIIEIEDINIAPTNTPTPMPGATKAPQIPGTVLSLPTSSPTPVNLQNETQPASVKDYFSFSMDQSDIDFGVVDPTNPVIRTHTFTLSPGTSHGMSLFAYANHPLQLGTQDIHIQDTTCDDGLCSQTLASLWDNTLTYGFGFRCENLEHQEAVCAEGFNNKQLYRQFADVAKNETAQNILTTFTPTASVSAGVTLKVNIPGTQTTGAYTNSVVFIAAPIF